VPRHGYKSLSIRENIYRELERIKHEKGLTSINDVITYLIDSHATRTPCKHDVKVKCLMNIKLAFLSEIHRLMTFIGNRWKIAIIMDPDDMEFIMTYRHDIMDSTVVEKLHTLTQLIEHKLLYDKLENING